jgi:hypothetical protein
MMTKIKTMRISSYHNDNLISNLKIINETTNNKSSFKF